MAFKIISLLSICLFLRLSGSAANVLYVEESSDDPWSSTATLNGTTLISDEASANVVVGKNTTFHLHASGNLSSSVWLEPRLSRKGVAQLHSDRLQFLPNQQRPVELVVAGINAGRKVIVSFNCSDGCDNGFANLAVFGVRIDVLHSFTLDKVCSVLGWIYFAAWTVSFYPQILENFRRKSVVGLDFNFLTLNLVGFTAYSIFNCCLFWSQEIIDEYHQEEMYSEDPVGASDVAFSLHAVFATLLTICQCFIFERGSQRVSRLCFLLLSIFAVFALISVGLKIGNVISWLRLLNFISYIKLTITLLKYVPQAYYNFRRKSTVGWSIGNVLLDFTGGSLSVLQMFLVAYNYNDWDEIFGDFTKFGLGAISLIFDILFIVQHYGIYRNSRVAYVDVVEDTSSSEDSPIPEDVKM